MKILLLGLVIVTVKSVSGDDCPCLAKDNSRLTTYECPATGQCSSDVMQDYCGCGCQVCTKNVGQSCGGWLSRSGTCSPGLVCANKRNNNQIDLKTKTVGICIEEENMKKAAKKGKCGKSIVVKKQPSGVIYDYLRGNEKSCNYRFKGRRNQRVYASIKHVSFMGKQSKKCIPRFTLRDFSAKNKQSDVGVICTLSDVIDKGSFTSSSAKAQIMYKGPSKKTGYVLIEFRFLNEGESVTVAPQTSVTSPPPTVERGGRCAAALKGGTYMYEDPSCDSDGNFMHLQCQEWGADLKEDRCICVDPIDGTKTANRPPFCHSIELPTNQCSAEIEMTKRRVQESADPWALNGISYFPPKCDSKGNYVSLQCRESLYPFCRCVDKKFGNLTNTIAPDCDTQIEPSPTPVVAQSEVINRELRCPRFRCNILCRFGYNMGADNCPTCTCKRAQPGEKTDIERCFAESDRLGREIVEMMKNGQPSIPFPELPVCDSNGNYVKRQCTQLHGCYCVDPVTGRPSGFMTPECAEYKPCVKKRIQSITEILTNANSVKSAKKLSKLLEKDMANNLLQIKKLTTTADKDLLAQTYVEECTQFGDFNGTQCDPNRGCWCVDIDGQNVVGNRRTGVPSSECYGDQRQNAQIPMVVNDLYDHWLDVNITYPFYCTISHVTEEEDRYYYWTKNGVPINPNTHPRLTTEVVFYDFLQQASMMMTIRNVSQDDDGIYRCEMVDGSRDFHLSSTPVRFHVLTYEEIRAQAPPLPVPCNMTGCPNYCKYGYRLDLNNCPTCACKSFTEAEQMVVFYNMITERTNIFGSKGGRCQMERASALEVIRNANLTSQSTESFYAPVRLHAPPLCDDDGNYEQVQCREYVGCFCVNVFTGEPSGRKAPECTKLRKCINQQIDSMLHIVGRLSDQKKARKKAVSIKTEATVSSIRSELFKVAMDKLPEKFANEDSDYPVPNCEGHGEYIPQICSLYLGECWCVDSYGDELPGTRVREGEPLINCFQDFGVISGPSIQTPNNTFDAVEVSVRTGDSATLPCRVSSKTPDTYVQWSVRSISLDVWMLVDSRYTIIGDHVTDFSLKINDVTGMDSGYYSCNVYSTSRQFRSYTSRRSAGVMLNVLV
ncbi:thyroglobulin-like [Antedon mediterranea]|uniref:thyroglobulin-like n=1 Tax=Antedon mediterranea TaxID=105859 RepID=UPI003AF9A79E